MKSDAETLGPTRVKLTVEVTFDELKPSLDAAYKLIGRQIQVPGFRKGKVPPAIVDQRLGRGAVLDQAVNDALPALYVQAVQDNDLQPVGSPEVDVTRLADGEDLAFTAEVDVRPAIELPEYDGLEVEVAVLEVSDDDIEEQLQALRERFASLSDVDRAAADGDIVTIDLAASEDGEPIAEAQATGVSYQVGKGTMIDGLDEALAGMTAGEQRTFRSVLIGGDMSGNEVDIQVTVQDVKEQELPALDDEFAQTASEFDTVDELRGDLRERLTRGKRLEQAGDARDAVLERLLELVEVPLPDALVAADLESRRAQIDQQLAYAGITKEAYLDEQGQTVEEHEEELEKRVRDAITAQFVLDEVARREKIGLAEAELAQHISRRAQQAGVAPDDYAKHAVEHDHMSSLVNEVVRGKSLALLLERAAVKDTAGESVELATLQPDGTYAEPGESADDAEPGESAADAEPGESANEDEPAEPEGER